MAVLPLLVVFAQQLQLPRDDGVPWADWAVLELATRAVASGDQLTGAYSHFGFSHPGPFMFFWMAPFYAVSGQRFSGLVLGMMVFHIVCLAVLVLVVQKALGRLEGWAAAGVVLVFTWRFGIAHFRDPWNPHWVVAPLALLVVSAIAAWSLPRRWPLAVAVGAGSVALQSHVGTTATVLPLLVVAVVGAVRVHRASGARWAEPLWPAALLGALLWIAPALEQMTSDPGNVVLLARYARENRTSHPIDAVREPVLAALSWGPSPFPLGEAYGPRSPFLPPIEVSTTDDVLVGVSALVLVTGVVVSARRRGNTALALVGLLPLSAVVIQTAASMSLRDVASPYMFMPVLGISLAWWVGCAVYLARAGGFAFGRLVTGSPWPTRVAPVVVALVAVGVVHGSSAELDASSIPFGEGQSQDVVGAMIDTAEPYCGDARSVHIRSDAAAWLVSAALGAGLERCGTRVTFGPELSYLVGPRYRHTRSSAEAVVLSVVVSDGSARPPGRRVRLIDQGGFALEVEARREGDRPINLL